MYHRLSYHDAIRLRKYRIDQYSRLNRTKLWSNTRVLTQFRINEPLPARTGYALHGREGHFRRGFIQTGKIIEKDLNSIYQHSTLSQRSDSFSSFYRQQTNLYSTNRVLMNADINAKLNPSTLPKQSFENYGSAVLEEIKDRQAQAYNELTSGKTQRLPDEIPLEDIPTSKDSTFEMLGKPSSNMGSFSSEDCIICLELDGCRNRKWYHIYLKHIRHHRYRNHTVHEKLEHLGAYDPIPNRWGQKVCGLNIDRIKYWIACGAQLDPKARELLGIGGILPISPDTVIRASRLRERKELEDRITEYFVKEDQADPDED